MADHFSICLQLPKRRFVYINSFSPRPAKTIPSVILLCLTRYDFTRHRRASGWERVDYPVPKIKSTIIFLK